MCTDGFLLQAALADARHAVMSMIKLSAETSCLWLLG